MKKINSQAVPEAEQGSPNGKYRLFRRHLSVALGGNRDSGSWAGGHPFDLELTRVPSGAANFPLHQHSAQWEMYVFISGSGEMTDGKEKMTIGPNDIVLCPPEQAHKIMNTGTVDLVYYVIADHHPADVTFYPDTGKWGIKPQRKCFELKEVEYFEPGD
jgi:mannose-6-phosphate isomerase-like protein (cupin superfamily)